VFTKNDEEPEFRDYLQDMLETMDKMECFVEGINFEQFLAGDLDILCRCSSS
jgi:uncharacterized protein with HEPN domain